MRVLLIYFWINLLKMLMMALFYHTVLWKQEYLKALGTQNSN